MFDLNPAGGGASPRRHGWGGIVVHLRQDQFILVGIGVLIGITVIFAAGVERGKQLARSERALLSPTLAKTEHAPRPAGTSTTRLKSGASTTSREAEARPEAPVAEQKRAPSAAPKAGTPSKLAAGRSRYAIQIATYTRPQFAQQELARLQARGEAAFLVIRDGKTSIYVGPFPSKASAAEKFAALKTRYRDCFVRSL